MKRISFSPPRVDQEIINEVVDALKSGWITTGPKTKALEKEIVKMTHSRACLCVNSATAGMELMLRWFGVQAGDEVIVPAFTYCSTANVVVHLGAKPVMVDINEDDLCINLDQVEEAINEKTKAIIGVDLAGLPAQMDQIMRLAKQKASLFNPNHTNQVQMGRMLVMTDAAHSLGAQLNHQPAVLSSDAAVYSFHAVKNLTTAEGGAINLNLPDTFSVEDVYAYLNMLSLHGQSKDALAKFGKGSWEYDVLEAGYKCNMPDVLAAMGLVEIKRYEQDTLVKRQSLFERYIQGLAGTPGLTLPVMKTASRIGSYHLFLLRLGTGDRSKRDRIIDLMNDRGVSLNVHYKPLPLLSIYKRMGYDIDAYPVSKDQFDRVISLPLFYDLELSDVDYICKNLKEVLEAVGI